MFENVWPPFLASKKLEGSELLGDLAQAMVDLIDWKPIDDRPNDPESAQSGYNRLRYRLDPVLEGLVEMLEEELGDQLTSNYKLFRAVWNKYDPATKTYYHTDYNKPGDGVTIIYFPFPYDPETQKGGDTEVDFDGEVHRFYPEQYHYFVFDGAYDHKGNSFLEDDPRYCIAFQYNAINNNG